MIERQQCAVSKDAVSPVNLPEKWQKDTHPFTSEPLGSGMRRSVTTGLFAELGQWITR